MAYNKTVPAKIKISQTHKKISQKMVPQINGQIPPKKEKIFPNKRNIVRK
jgi:hypothetical protein